jgi:hypothetical protein
MGSEAGLESIDWAYLLGRRHWFTFSPQSVSVQLACANAAQRVRQYGEGDPSTSAISVSRAIQRPTRIMQAAGGIVPPLTLSKRPTLLQRTREGWGNLAAHAIPANLRDRDGGCVDLDRRAVSSTFLAAELWFGDAGRRNFCTRGNKFLDRLHTQPFTTGGTEVHRVSLCASPFVAEDWELRVLVGNADAVFVQLVGERAAGQSHAAGGFGLCAASCT